MRAKAMAGSGEFVTQFAKIVDFAVVEDREGFGLVPDGLAATCEVDDAQTASAGGETGRDARTFFIRTAMENRREHLAKNRGAPVGRFHSDDAANSAHARGVSVN